MRSGKQVAPEGLIGIEAEEMKTPGGVRYRSRAEVFPRHATERAQNEAEEEKEELKRESRLSRVCCGRPRGCTRSGTERLGGFDSEGPEWAGRRRSRERVT